MKQTAARVYAGLLSGALCGLMLFSYIGLEQIAWLWRQPSTCGVPWMLVAEHNFTDDISVKVRRLLHAPKIFCLVLTYPANYDTKAIHCQNTWVRRCDKYWFLGSEPHASLKLIDANVSFQEGRSQLWRKMRQIWPIVARVDFPYDYVYKADDDTYAVVENMRFALAGFDSQDPFMTGFTWPPNAPDKPV
ncbi:unnamed protein product [Dicrocoelium dendriticum]|nr:unnamed protein product [Dicrocoelium dendriticum]